jgi:hypothetical protein
MAVKIRGGSSTSKARPAAKRGPKTAPRKTAAKAPAQRTSKNRSSKTDLPERQLERILGNLEKAADLRTELFEAHREAVDASNRLILDAEEQGVPVHMIVEAGKIARQQFYKLLQDAESGKLGNGLHGAARQRPGRKAQPKPKRAPKANIAPKSTKTVARKTAAKPAAKRAVKSGGVKIRRKG